MFCTFGRETTRPKLLRKGPALTESIYNLVPRPEVPVQKPQRYQSRYNDAVKQFYDSIKSPHRTMGYYQTPLPAPQDYLKKHSKEPHIEKRSFTYPDEDRRKPPVPTLKEMLPKPAEPTKNFIKENVRNVLRTAPPKPIPKTVDTKNGDIVVLEFSGLVPKFCMKKEFGKTPKYIVQRKVDMDYSQKAYNDFIAEQRMKGAPHKLTHEERNDLIKGLKENWSQLHHDYLGLSLVTDTLRKKARKERLEDQLHSLEQDINLLERHEDIYVINTDHE